MLRRPILTVPKQIVENVENVETQTRASLHHKNQCYSGHAMTLSHGRVHVPPMSSIQQLLQNVSNDKKESKVHTGRKR